MRWVRQTCVLAWLGVLGFSSPFLGTCLLTFPASGPCPRRATHVCHHVPAPHTVHTHMRWGRVCTEGLAGEGVQAGHPAGSLTHSSSHLCSPRNPVTSPLCVSRAAQQVSEASSSPAKATSFPGTRDRVTEGSLAPSAGRAEPGSRRWLLPAAPSGRHKAARGGWTVWPRRAGWGLQTSQSGDQRRSRQWGHA